MGRRGTLASVVLTCAATSFAALLGAGNAAGQSAPSTAPVASASATQRAAPAKAAPVQITGVPRPSRDATRFVITPDAAAVTAGTEGDGLKIVQSLPGLARPPLGSGQLVVWGSSPEDTQVYVDGVPIPALFHGGGLRGTVNGDLVKSIDFAPGGYGAEYGRGTGGVVRVATKDVPEGTHGFVAADTLDGSAMASTTLGERVKLALVGRYGWLDPLLTAVSPSTVNGAGVNALFPVPQYEDLQAKVSIALRPDETLDAVYLGSADALTRGVASSDPAAVEADTTKSAFQRVYLHYQRVGEDGSSVVVTPFVGYDTSSVAERYGAVPGRVDESTWQYGARASERARLAPAIVVTTGVDVLGSRSSLARSGSLTLPPREGDVTVFGEAPSNGVAADVWSTHILDIGPFAFADVSVGPLTITPGARVDAFLIDVDRTAPQVGTLPPVGDSHLDGTFDPRISARLAVSPRFAVNAAAGVYHEPPNPQDLSAVFGTPSLGPSDARHYTLGESLAITRALTLEATAFYKDLADLPVRTRLQTPKLSTDLIPDGVGRAYGVQVLLRQELWRGLFGWASWTVSRSERQYLGDTTWRLFDYDQTHVGALIVSQRLGAFTFGARFRFATGYPRTPVAYGYYDARSQQYDPVFGAQNSSRLPTFYELDLRVDRTFPLGETRLTAYLEALNVTNHKNDEEVQYSYDFAQKGYITGLPALAVVGVRWER